MPEVKRILLVTNSYPAEGSAERSFVYPELVELVAAGFEVTLMPVHRFSRVDAALPAGVRVSNELAACYSRVWSFVAIFDLLFRREFWSEIIERPTLLLRFRFWKDSLRAAVSARLFSQLRGRFDLFYTYWFSGETTGMCFARVSPLVSRAHGYDLYVERRENGGWIPYRRFDLSHINKVVLLSRRVCIYLNELYGFESDKTVVSPLGVEDRDPAPADRCNADNSVVFMSCSYPAAVKRLPLIFRFVAAFARENAHLKVCWVHIGAQREQLMGGEALGGIPSNLYVDALGARSNSYVQDFFSSRRIDFFVNLSEMEGLPVSIMEAMAFGIPVIATNVGCVADLLEDGGGILVEPSFSMSELIGIVGNVLSDPGRYSQMRLSARSSQRQKFNGKRNHAMLAEYMSELVNVNRT